MVLKVAASQENVGSRDKLWPLGFGHLGVETYLMVTGLVNDEYTLQSVSGKGNERSEPVILTAEFFCLAFMSLCSNSTSGVVSGSRMTLRPF